MTQPNACKTPTEPLAHDTSQQTPKPYMWLLIVIARSQTQNEHVGIPTQRGGAALTGRSREAGIVEVTLPTYFRRRQLLRATTEGPTAARSALLTRCHNLGYLSKGEWLQQQQQQPLHTINTNPLTHVSSECVPKSAFVLMVCTHYPPA